MYVDIHFVKSESIVLAACHNFQDRQTVLTDETIESAVLEKQLLECVRGFLKIMGPTTNIPWVHALLTEWLEPLDDKTKASLGLAPLQTQTANPA